MANRKEEQTQRLDSEVSGRTGVREYALMPSSSRVISSSSDALWFCSRFVSFEIGSDWRVRTHQTDNNIRKKNKMQFINH
jgi:hypothetical protein